MTNYILSFSNPTDIRMGSPYNVATVHLVGPYVPDLSLRCFQDIGLVSKNGQHCYLVHWDLPNNEPGFRIWHIDGSRKEVLASDRYSGICINLQEIPEGLKMTVTEYDSASKDFLDRTEYYVAE